MPDQTTGATADVSRRDVLALAGGAGAIALAGCLEETDDGEGLSGAINIAGSSTVFPLMSAFAEEFQRDHDGVNIDISETGSGGGFSNHFCEGSTHFNNASRPIRPTEEEQCGANDIEYVELVVATDALTIIVNNDNDFLGDPPCLTVEELAQIWEADAAEMWSDVDSSWPDEPIDRFGAADTSGTYDYLIEHIQGEERGHTADYQATEQDNTIVQGVQGSEYGIGYLGFSYYYQNPEAVTAVGIDDGNGCVQPSLDTAGSGEYTPLSRSLYTYPKVSALAEEHVAEFARFVVEQTTNEDLVANEVGYVPLTEEAMETQLETLESAIDEAG